MLLYYFGRLDAILSECSFRDSRPSVQTTHTFANRFRIRTVGGTNDRPQIHPKLHHRRSG